MSNVAFCYDIVVIENEVVLISNGNIMTMSRIVIEWMACKKIFFMLRIFSKVMEKWPSHDMHDGRDRETHNKQHHLLNTCITYCPIEKAMQR